MHSCRRLRGLASRSTSPLAGPRVARAVAAIIRSWAPIGLPWARTAEGPISARGPGVECVFVFVFVRLDHRTSIPLSALSRQNRLASDVLPPSPPTPTEIDDHDIVALIVVLMFAGHETTTALLGNTFLALNESPDQRTQLQEQPDLIDNAIEEFLRYDPPAQIAVRTTTGPVQAGNVTIPTGANVALMIGAANRDTRQWPDADRLRIDRPDLKPISFGHGIHHCLGSALSRLEMRAAIPAFLNSFDNHTIAPDGVAWKQSTTLRGPTTLTIEREP